MQESNTRARRFSFDTAVVWSLGLTLALAAIVLIPSPVIPFIFTKASILALGGLVTLALYILARLTRGNIIVPPILLVGSLWLVPLAYALSTLFSGENLGAAFFGTQLGPDTFGFVLIAAGLATLSALAIRRAENFRTFFKIIGVALGVILLTQLVFVVLGLVAPQVVSTTVNVVGSFSDMGMIVGLGLAVMLLALRFLTLGKKTKIAVIVASILGLIALALVNSFLVWSLVAIVALGLFIETIMRRKVQTEDDELIGVATLSTDETLSVSQTSHSSSSVAVPLVVLVVALFFLIGGSTIGSALSQAIGNSSLDVRPSWQATFDVGSHTYAASPIFGSGPGTFGSQWAKFRDRTINDTVFWSVDFTSGIGYIPTSFVTEGILGALAWIAFLLLFLFVGIRALLFRMPEDPFIRFASVASFVGAVYVFVLSVFTVPSPVLLATGFVLVGVFISSLRFGARQEWGILFSRNPRVGFAVVFALTLLLLASVAAAYVVVERYMASVAYGQASAALSAGNLTQADAAINSSILFAPSASSYRLATAIGISHMNQIANDSSLSKSDAQKQFQTALSTTVNAAITATRLGPNDYSNWVALGNVYGAVVPLNISGAYDNAKTAYQHAITLNPTNPTLPFILAQLEIAQKNYDAATKDLTDAINLKHDYTQAIFLLSQLEVQEGKAKEALQTAEAAAYFAPNDPTILFQVGILRSGNGDQDGAITALSTAVDLNPQYANARFFLAVAYATKGQYADALTQLQAVADLSADNAKAVASDIAALKAGKNPFPASRIGALGILQTPIKDTSGSTK